MNNKAYPSYRQIIGISLILFSIVSFLFPHLFQSSLESKELVEKVDYRIRLSAVPLGIGLFFILLSKFQSKHILTQSLILAFFIDMGYFTTRLLSMSIHGFDSTTQLYWLSIELVIGITLAVILKLKKAPSKT
ncbi:MAG: hypothetical protein CBC92_004890 [Euryarchaeota archaeon TMED132]|nr:hypothetical protein [Euryarchaeota archaeon]RAH05797.1 MAG: hypothetical protein CBC92_004890 [Euryarchaeota archaeon TMED132]